MSATKSQSSYKHVVIERLGHSSINQDDAVVGSGLVHIPSTNVPIIHVSDQDVDSKHLNAVEHAGNFSIAVKSNYIQKKATVRRTPLLQEAIQFILNCSFFLSPSTSHVLGATYRTP